MEKKKAHYLLEEVKALIANGSVRATRSALAGASALGFSFKEMLEIVTDLEARDFYKSMTTHNDNKIWQDVYHFPTKAERDIYIKLSVVDKVLIVSFKAK